MAINTQSQHFSTRSRTVQSELRKRQIIDATVDCINKLGFSQTTLARIASHAGVSQGIVIFHFKSKEALFEHTLRQLSREYMDCWQNACHQTDSDPMSQLHAMIKSVFSPAICNRKKISVWYAFWGEARSRPKYLQLCGENDFAFSSRLLTLCEQIGASSTASLTPKTAALSIEGMIDGLWQNFLIGPAGHKRQDAINAVFELVAIIYPDHHDKVQQLSPQSN